MRVYMRARTCILCISICMRPCMFFFCVCMVPVIWKSRLVVVGAFWFLQRGWIEEGLGWLERVGYLFNLIGTKMGFY